MKEKHLQEIARNAKKVSYELAALSSRIKNDALVKMAAALSRASGEILRANKKDMEVSKGLSPALIDRLCVNKSRINWVKESWLQ